MANHVYPLYKKALLSTGELLPGENIDLLDADVRVALIDTGAYTYDATDEYLSQIASGAIIAFSNSLSGKTVSDDAAFNSDDPVFPSVSGAQCEALIMFIEVSGNDAASRLIFYQDTGITGMPITPNGGDITVTVDPSGWFTL